MSFIDEEHQRHIITGRALHHEKYGLTGCSQIGVSGPDSAKDKSAATNYNCSVSSMTHPCRGCQSWACRLGSPLHCQSTWCTSDRAWCSSAPRRRSPGCTLDTACSPAGCTDAWRPGRDRTASRGRTRQWCRRRSSPARIRTACSGWRSKRPASGCRLDTWSRANTGRGPRTTRRFLEGESASVSWFLLHGITTAFCKESVSSQQG